MGRFGEYTRRVSGEVTAWRYHAKEKRREYAQRVIRPKVFEKFVDDGPPDRVLQILALFLVGPVVVVSLVIIQVINNVISDLFGTGSFGDQSSLWGWMVTGLTGGLFLLAAWSWFQFVRTYGFGLLKGTRKKKVQG